MPTKRLNLRLTHEQMQELDYRVSEHITKDAKPDPGWARAFACLAYVGQRTNKPETQTKPNLYEI